MDVALPRAHRIPPASIGIVALGSFYAATAFAALLGFAFAVVGFVNYDGTSRTSIVELATGAALFVALMAWGAALFCAFSLLPLTWASSRALRHLLFAWVHRLIYAAGGCVIGVAAAVVVPYGNVLGYTMYNEAAGTLILGAIGAIACALGWSLALIHGRERTKRVAMHTEAAS